VEKVEKVEREQPWLFAVALPKAKVTRVKSSKKGVLLKSPKLGFQTALFWLIINGGVILTTYKSWDDPPSGGLLFLEVKLGLG